ncbi:hypothetical protein ACE25E_003834, partial [Vibrio cholerae]
CAIRGKQLSQEKLECSYGRMCLSIHQIERDLSLILTAQSCDDQYSNWNVEYQKFRKLTLGKLVGSVKSKGIFDDELVGHLQTIVKYRNELVHEIGDLVADSIFSEGKSSDFISFIDDFTFLVREMNHILNMELNKMIPDLNINALKNIVEPHVKKWHT